MNISARLLVWFLFIALVPFFSLTLIINSIGERNARAQIFDTLTVSANNQVSRLERYVQDQQRSTELLARQSILTTSTHALQDDTLTAESRTMRTAQIREYLRQLLPKTDYSDVILIGLEGEILFSVGRMMQNAGSIYETDFAYPSLREAAENALTLLNTNVSNLMVMRSGQTIIFIATPIYLGNRVVGVVATRLDSTRLYEIVTDRIGLGETGETIVGMLSGTEVIFTAPTRSNPDAAFNIRVPLGAATGQAIQRAVQGIRGQGEQIDYRGISTVAVWRYVPSLRWGLVVKQDSSEAFAILSEQRRVFALLVAVTLALVALVAYFVARTFTQPVKRLTQAVAQMSGGDLRTRVGDIGANGEFKVLATGFDHMAGELNDLVEGLEGRIAERTRQLERYAQDMAAARAEADRANAAKTTFLTNMSHELRTPLNAILGFAQMLQTDTAVPAKQREHIGTIARSGEHLLGLINELLDMARIESGQIVVTETAFDLRYMLHGIEEMMTLRADAKHLQLEFEIADDVPQYIRTDEGKLRQVIINLVGNGIKFTADGGVSVRCGVVPAGASEGSSGSESSSDHLRFEIEDTGAGIPEEELRDLFQPFSQTEVGMKAQEGTGLGLAISRAYMRAMGGDITVSSTPDQGTTFTFDLEFSTATQEEVRTGIEHNRRPIGIAPPDDSREWRILVVDDKPENRQLMRLWMEEVGFGVREASNGKEALELWEAWEPQLIWMDMRMPVLNGYEATRQIKSTVKGDATAVIALTASALDGERQLVMSAGCDDFVRKPARVSTIFEKLEQHLGVRFLYEQPEAPSEIAAPERKPLNREVMQTLPEAWRKRLGDTVRRLDMDGAQRIVQEIQTDHPEIAQELRDLINSFRFDTLQELV